MYVTKHAAAQYVERIDPAMSRECARAHLIREVVRAESTGERTEVGHTIWRIPGALLIAKHDPKYGMIVVTVLSPGMPAERAGHLADAEDEVVAAARRANAPFPSTENLDGRSRRSLVRARLRWKKRRLK